MSFSYDRYDRKPAPRQGRSTLGYWVPLIFTVTVATAGLAAWVWSEREDSTEDSDNDADLSYGEEQRDGQHYSTATGAATREHGAGAHGDEGLVSRVQHAIRRTPSPQQLFDTVSKRTVAGVTAAGAAAGAMLASIREEDKDAFDDHSRWSEEAALRRHVEAQSAESRAAVESQTRAFAESARSAAQGQSQSGGGRRKTVAVVVSAEALGAAQDEEGEWRSETATLLSLLPPTDPSKTKLFILIYAPSLHNTAPNTSGAPSLTSSYSAISTPAATTPGEAHTSLRSIDPAPYFPDSSLYSTLHSQATRLVENPTMVMPFSTPTGHIHMLRHIAPDLVYIVDALSGVQGRNVEDLKRWVGQTVVVVDSDGSGLGALVDTDDESASSGKGKEKASEHGHLQGEKWWESSDLVGLGKGVEIVDASRFGEDFERRAGGRE